MKFRKHYLLMNKIEDEAGSAGAGAGNEPSGGEHESTDTSSKGGDQVSTDQGDDPIAKLKAEYDARLEAMDKKNSDLLNKLASSKKQLEEIENSKREAEMKRIEEEGDFKAKAEIYKRDYEELLQKVTDMEEAEIAKKESLLHEARVAEFKKRMGDVEFYDFEEAIKSVDFSKFIMEDSGWNEAGIKQAVEDFKTNKHYHFKSKKPDLNAEAAGGKKHKKEDTYKQYLKTIIEE